MYWKGNGRSFVIKALWKVDDLRVDIGGGDVVAFSGVVRETDGVGGNAELMSADDLDLSDMTALRTITPSEALAGQASWVSLARYCLRQRKGLLVGMYALGQRVFISSVSWPVPAKPNSSIHETWLLTAEIST
jgi:hypothetical protein